MMDAMSRLRRVLWTAILVTLLVFGVVADHALLDQARLAREVNLGEEQEKARLTVASVGAALTEVEQDVLSGEKRLDVATGRLANPSGLAGPSVSYQERSA